MLVAFTFRAKAGKEKEFEDLLHNPEAARQIARLMGATRNTLFLGGGRMVRILEFPKGAKPVSLTEIAAKDAGVRDFLAKLGPSSRTGSTWNGRRRSRRSTSTWSCRSRSTCSRDASTVRTIPASVDASTRFRSQSRVQPQGGTSSSRSRVLYSA